MTKTNMIAAHESTLASREFPCQEATLETVYRAISHDGSVKEIAKEVFFSFEGEKGYFLADCIGSEGEYVFGVPFEEFQKSFSKRMVSESTHQNQLSDRAMAGDKNAQAELEELLCG